MHLGSVIEEKKN